MNFEKIELYGFKSFADKAEIKFGNGITGIVGRNGCGKSNVADAIRWVLGEQSAKTLRGSSMQDVIFSGTQNRKSLSYCEVSLFFDNSNKMFSLDYGEVIITRKLYRSGESEYFINKQPARLKDIVDLLHECGIGKEGYTIIGQGKVEEIMSAKPEDRRLIFEEATGIAKNKTRKNESERKLERTHENVLRYSDILTEIENQLAPLSRQAEKAKEFNELSEELKRHELNTYIVKVETVEDSKKKYYTKIAGINDEAEKKRSDLSDAQKEYDKIYSEIEKADIKLQNLNDELLEKRVNMEKSSGAKQLYEQKISYMQSQIERAKDDIVKNEELIDNSQKSIEENELSLNNYKIEDKRLKSDMENLKGELFSVSEKISLGEELSIKNREQIIESIENLSNFKINKGTMSVEKTNLSEKLEELKKKSDELAVKRNDFFSQKDKCDKNIDSLDRAVFDLKNQITEKEDEVRSGNENVSKIENQAYNLNSVITALTTRDGFYRSLKENYDGYAPSVKALLNKAKEVKTLKEKINGVVAELIKCDKKYDIALETALAAASQNVVTPTPDDARFLIDYLKQNGIGRITFLPITSIKPREKNYQVDSALSKKGALGVANELVEYDPKYENVVSNLLGNTLIVDTLENATEIAKEYKFAFKIVTLDGEVFQTQGSITGGSRKAGGEGLLSNDRKLEEIAEQLKIKRAEMDKLDKEKASLSIKRDKSLDEMELLNERYNEKRQEIILEREKQALAEKSLIEIGKEIESNQELIDEVNKRLLSLDEKFQSVNSGSKKLEEERLSASKRADIQQAEYDALVKKQNELKEKISDLQVKITENKGKMDAVNLENERLNKLITESKTNIERLKESNLNAEKIIESLKRDEEKVALTKEEQDCINKIRKEIESIDSLKQQYKVNLDKNSLLKQSLTEELEELTEKKHANEISLSKIDSDLEYLEKSVWEEYQETYETAKKCRDENYDVENGEKEIDRIRKKRASLGAINAQAIDDYKALKERYEEMQTQKEDLVKAEDDLKTAIDKIKAEMLTQFDEGFNKINLNFQKIFKELFGGGKAMLELDYTDVTDKLEAGIEIIAEPPGKKLQKLSLLSGGEKALTAIAILFAILRLRPMPFCVLDEIEAALDEANVDRFASYLQKFSEETQFIVITHRKPTMEKADSLFGVTMQEKGVSKTVSVKLSDVSEIDSELS